MSKYKNALIEDFVLQNRYVITRVLGQGGFGITYEATDSTTDQKVAIKEYYPSDIAFREKNGFNVYTAYENIELYQYGLTRFIDEANALARFKRHPGIVAVYDLFLENDTAYMVMQFLDGVTLLDLTKQYGGKLPIDVAHPILLLTLDALRPIHEVGMLHRDISPDNVIIMPNQQVKIIDFGAARYALKNQQQVFSIIFKAGYTPVEQYMSKGNIGPWSDIYALSATFYRVITGRVPLESMNRYEQDTLLPPSRMGVKIHPLLEKTLLKGMEVKVDDRYKSVNEMKEAILALKVDAVERKKTTNTNPFVILLVAVIGISVLLFFFIFLLFLFS